MNKSFLAYFSVAATAFILTGCATNKVWYHPDKTNAEMEQDWRECRYDAEKYSTGAGAGYETGVGTGLAIGLKQVELMKRCLEAKGYRHVSQKELPPGATVNRMR